MQDSNVNKLVRKGVNERARKFLEDRAERRQRGETLPQLTRDDWRQNHVQWLAESWYHLTHNAIQYMH